LRPTLYQNFTVYFFNIYKSKTEHKISLATIAQMQGDNTSKRPYRLSDI